MVKMTLVLEFTGLVNFNFYIIDPMLKPIHG